MSCNIAASTHAAMGSTDIVSRYHPAYIVQHRATAELPVQRPPCPFHEPRTALLLPAAAATSAASAGLGLVGVTPFALQASHFANSPAVPKLSMTMKAGTEMAPFGCACKGSSSSSKGGRQQSGSRSWGLACCPGLLAAQACTSSRLSFLCPSCIHSAARQRPHSTGPTRAPTAPLRAPSHSPPAAARQSAPPGPSQTCQKPPQGSRCASSRLPAA